jgi:hypothetical protein
MLHINVATIAYLPAPWRLGTQSILCDGTQFELRMRKGKKWETRMATSKNGVGAARTAESLLIRQK